MACKMRVGGGECSEVMDKQAELYPCAMICEQRSPARTQQPRQIVVDELPQALLNCSRGKIQPHRLEKLGGQAFSAHRKKVMNHTDLCRSQSAHRRLCSGDVRARESQSVSLRRE